MRRSRHRAKAPPAVQERAKYLLLDGTGCALVGAQLPWSRTAVESVTAFEGGGDTPIIGWGTTTAATAAAVLNSTFIKGIELDDLHPLAVMHSNSALIPTLLSAAHLDPTVSGARFVGAAIVGYWSGPRASLGLHGAEMPRRGWNTVSVFGNITSAAAAANVLRLDAAKVEDALGHGATQSFGLMATQFGAMSQRMLAGWSARNGQQWPNTVPIVRALNALTKGRELPGELPFFPRTLPDGWSGFVRTRAKRAANSSLGRCFGVVQVAPKGPQRGARRRTVMMPET